jgi:hypothetical protein
MNHIQCNVYMISPRDAVVLATIAKQLDLHWSLKLNGEWSAIKYRIYRNLTILGRQRDDGQNKLLQINGIKDNSSYIINRMNLTQS